MLCNLFSVQLSTSDHQTLLEASCCTNAHTLLLANHYNETIKGFI